MVTLRATRKVLGRLPRPIRSVDVPSNTALGDWYVTRLVVDRQPLLLLVSSRSLLAILAPARDVRGLAGHLPDLVAARLRRLGVPAPIAQAEISAMAPVHVGPTRDRSVVGSMTDFAKSVPHYLEVGGWDTTTLPFVEARLAETPCRTARQRASVIFPEQEAPRLLAAKWPMPMPSIDFKLDLGVHGTRS